MTFNADIFLTGDEHDARDHAGVPNVATYQFGFGGDMIAGATFYGPATGTPGPHPGPPPNPLVSHPLPAAGFLVGVAWVVGIPGGSYNLYINGVPAMPPIVPLAPIGYLPLPPVAVAPGDTAELELAAPPAPGVSSFVFFVQG